MWKTHYQIVRPWGAGLGLTGSTGTLDLKKEEHLVGTAYKPACAILEDNEFPLPRGV